MNYHSLRSYSKINLFLEVGNWNKKDKLHNIQSLVFISNLYDEIKIKRIFKHKDVIKFYGNFAKHVKKSDNSILKSLILLRRTGYIKPSFNYRIEIKKKIPVFSGLGGGSSNSASIIKFFLKRKKLSVEDLKYFSKKLGSDIKLFFKSNQIVQKSLSKIINLKNKKVFYFVIVYPYIKCSTKEIYSKFVYQKIIKKNYNYDLTSKFKLIKILKLKNNNLEKIVVKKFPVIRKILDELRENNSCKLSRMTGSGSACFGLFLTKKSAELGLKKIKKKFPKYWCVISKTI